MNVPAVRWAGSAESAKSEASTRDQPYLLFFCNEEAAKFAGEGSKAVMDYRAKAKGKVAQPTVFDALAVAKEAQLAGVPMAKVTPSKENLPLLTKYRVSADPTLVLCAPNGDAMAVMAGGECRQPAVCSLLRSVKDAYAAWKRAHPAKPTGAAPAIP